MLWQRVDTAGATAGHGRVAVQSQHPELSPFNISPASDRRNAHPLDFQNNPNPCGCSKITREMRNHDTRAVMVLQGVWCSKSCALLSLSFDPLGI